MFLEEHLFHPSWLYFARDEEFEQDESGSRWKTRAQEKFPLLWLTPSQTGRLRMHQESNGSPSFTPWWPVPKNPTVLSHMITCCPKLTASRFFLKVIIIQQTLLGRWHHTSFLIEIPQKAILKFHFPLSSSLQPYLSEGSPHLLILQPRGLSLRQSLRTPVYPS